MKFKTILTARAQVVKPNSEDFKTVAASLKDRYGFELKPQIDLLYLRSCLVSAGNKVGVNENDDIFTREEVWAARHTPVLKPFNWQHQDKDILGVIYTVQARDVNGNVLDINSDDVPACDFDLWTEAAIFKLIHEDRSREIEERAVANKLFVSMEAWFDDYGYGFFDETQEKALSKIVARNQDTSFLDRHLRASGGTGTYRDPESSQDVRIGRVLRSITFGGCGLVDRPANKRSFIEEVGQMASVSELDAERQIELFLQQLIVSESPVEEVTLMNVSKASEGASPVEQISAALSAELDKRDAQAAKARAEQELQSRITASESKAVALETQVDELTAANTAKEAELKALQEQLSEYGKAVDSLVKEATAGATSDTPAEIALVDSAKDGAAAFQAKLSWISKSMASLRTRAARASELEAQLAEAEQVVREQDVRALLGNVVSEDALGVFVTHASKLNAEAYTAWRDEKELIVLEITAAAEKKMPEAFKKKGKVKPEDEEMPEKECANLFATLLQKRRSDSGMANPDTMEGNPNEPSLINHPGGPGQKSGVSPEALRTPRHKIAGSIAGNDPAKLLESAQEIGGVQLAGAKVGDEGGDESGAFRTLAALVTGAPEEDESQGRPDFDPVR